MAGFSLVELALVMLIIAFLVSGAILPLASSIDRARVGEARNELDQRVRQALLGYAASRPLGTVFMPCPDCTAACGGPVPNDGLEDRIAGACAVVVGNLPWVTLGLGEADPWGSRYGYGITPGFADATGFTLTVPDLSAGGIGAVVRDAAGNPLIGGPGSENAPVIVWSFGKNRLGAISSQGVAQPPPPAANLDELENADADADYVSRALDPDGAVEQFDDVLIWLSGPEVRGFMVHAGRLP